MKKTKLSRTKEHSIITLKCKSCGSPRSTCGAPKNKPFYCIDCVPA